MIKSIKNTVNVLDCFYDCEQSLNLTEIVKRTGMNKSTVHHLLSTLVETRLLQKTANNRYKLGIKLFELGSLVISRLEIEEIAKPFLKELNQRYEETVHLAVLEGLDAVFIQKIESNRAIRMFSMVGQRMPLYCTGIGKVFLAYHEVLLPSVLEQGLERRTEHTITEEKNLKKELGLTRDRGCAIDREEMEDGLISVAAPIWDYTGKVTAAISVTGSSNRMKSIGIDRIAATVKQSGKQMSEKLGYYPRLFNQ